MTKPQTFTRLSSVIDLSTDRRPMSGSAASLEPLDWGRPLLVVLAAGKGTRFGTAPKCIQPVAGVPLARHSIDAFRRLFDAPVICLVHYRKDEVMAALGPDVGFVHSADPTGGTAYAAYETFSVPGLAEHNPLLILTMGDRIVPEAIFRRLCQVHGAGPREAQLTLLSARYQPPRHLGKGRIVRDASGQVLRIVEQRDIDALSDPVQRRLLRDTTEANCPLYAVRAATLMHYLGRLSCENAQQQYYITDIVDAIVREGGEVRTLTTSTADPEYDLLCSDVTHPRDLALLEGILGVTEPLVSKNHDELQQAVCAIRRDRSAGQIASIANQLRELLDMAEQDRLEFEPDLPVAIGMAGGRLRIAFMHPDMGRFFGPAWQMPIGAADAQGREQILVMLQRAEDGGIHLYPADAALREKHNSIPADSDCMYPGADVTDWYAYENFGTRMTERLLLSLGYFSDAEIQRRRAGCLPLPPPSLWASNGMRRPFALICNAIASMRTLRSGALGATVQASLGRENFRGLRLTSTGHIPRGGFSSSSAVTVAVKNAVNALYDLKIPPDMLIHLACQAEYGTGVRAGTLDQATAQKGKPGEGVVISSNPRDNYRVLGVFPAPTERFKVIFPYTVDRDREAGAWSAGMYGESETDALPTPEEIRKLTGKSAELAALLTQLPLDQDFFPPLQDDLLRTGQLGAEAARWVNDTLRCLPLCITREALTQQLAARRPWLIEQFSTTRNLDAGEAARQADATVDALLGGWRDPCLRLPEPDGSIRVETGVPLRAMVAYLFGEVCKNFYLIHHPERWIATVTQSQAGDRCFDIDPEALPDAEAMLGALPWEAGLQGPERMERWLVQTGAKPVDFNRGLDDAALSRDPLPPPDGFIGGNFFRGLALIDLAEAMLKRAFGSDAIAVRVNAAGQGDYFQVHVDSRKAALDTVKDFLRQAFYRRFGLAPDPAFIQPHTGGGAVGVRLSRFDRLPELIAALE